MLTKIKRYFVYKNYILDTLVNVYNYGEWHVYGEFNFLKDLFLVTIMGFFENLPFYVYRL